MHTGTHQTRAGIKAFEWLIAQVTCVVSCILQRRKPCTGWWQTSEMGELFLPLSYCCWSLICTCHLNIWHPTDVAIAPAKEPRRPTLSCYRYHDSPEKKGPPEPTTAVVRRRNNRDVERPVDTDQITFQRGKGPRELTTAVVASAWLGPLGSLEPSQSTGATMQQAPGPDFPRRVPFHSPQGIRFHGGVS